MLIILRAYGLSQRQKYEVFDTLTDSFLKGEGILHKCVNYFTGVGVVPAYGDKDGNLDKYLVVSKIGDKYKVIKRTNTIAKVLVRVLDRSAILKLIDIKDIVNASVEDGKLKISGYYETIDEDIAYRLNVDKLYSRFMAKASLIGMDMSFKYRVEGHRVILTEYTGHSNTLIVPDFVTSIGYMAFYKNTSLSDIEMPRKLDGIGAYTFSMTNITHVDMPEEVKFRDEYIYGK